LLLEAPMRALQFSERWFAQALLATKRHKRNKS
jgi:hypothetical protein